MSWICNFEPLFCSDGKIQRAIGSYGQVWRISEYSTATIREAERGDADFWMSFFRVHLILLLMLMILNTGGWQWSKHIWGRNAAFPGINLPLCSRRKMNPSVFRRHMWLWKLITDPSKCPMHSVLKGNRDHRAIKHQYGHWTMLTQTTRLCRRWSVRLLWSTLKSWDPFGSFWRAMENILFSVNASCACTKSSWNGRKMRVAFCNQKPLWMYSYRFQCKRALSKDYSNFAVIMYNTAKNVLWIQLFKWQTAHFHSLWASNPLVTRTLMRRTGLIKLLVRPRVQFLKMQNKKLLPEWQQMKLHQQQSHCHLPKLFKNATPSLTEQI